MFLKMNACLQSSSMSSSGLMSSLILASTCYIGMSVNVSKKRSYRMDKVSDVPTQHLREAGPKKKSTGSGRIFGVALWVIGLIILGVAAYLVHTHINPWPIELALTKDLQGPHPLPCPIPIQPHSWFEAILFDVSQLNNPI